MFRACAPTVFVLIVLLTVSIIHGDYEHPDQSAMEPVPSREVKCLVCKATIAEMKRSISKIDRRKTTDIPGGRKVRLINSEGFLTELMETVCKSMDDYAKARYKKTRELTILKFTTESGGMNPDMSEVDFVYDGDLNKSLEHFCLEILEDHEDVFLDYFMKDELPSHVEQSICYEAAKYCTEADRANDEL